MILSFTSGNAQIGFPTNREIYNFSIGDTFVYQSFHYYDACSCYLSICYRVIVTSKSFSVDSNSVFYTYNTGAYGSYYPLDTSYSNLDSAVLPFTGLPFGGIDTEYPDTTTYCVSRTIALYETLASLSDNFKYGWASGLGMADDIYYAEQGTSQDNNYAISLIYYNKNGVACGNYNPQEIWSGINSL